MISLDQVKHLSETMKRLGKTYEDKVYPGAGHGFFCDERSSYDEASAKDAWTKLTPGSRATSDSAGSRLT
jgi:carboxymethylenebutenolidase